MEVKPDIVHTWDNISSLVTLPLKPLLRFRWVNGMINGAPRNLLSWGYPVYLGVKFSFAFSDYIMANSKAGLISFGPPAVKSGHIYNGFDFHRISRLQDKNLIRKKFLLNKPKIVGMVASFSKTKDYSCYIQAAELVLKHRKDIQFICVGSGDSSACQKRIQPQNLDSIRFLGLQKNIESIMNVCDLGILSTHSEGISNAILEFMALGKVVIATVGGGTAELVQENITGFLIPPKSPQILADRILSIIDDPRRLSALGKNSERRVRTVFGLERMICDFERLYGSVVKPDPNRIGKLNHVC
jgi:glycosyltransferase involved in cell wall biosynthesis